MKNFEVKGRVELFPQKGGWYYVRIPKKYTNLLSGIADRGLIPITVILGKTRWKTSLLPMGDGTHFIALKASVRKAEDIDLGDRINLRFTLRNR